MKHIVCVIALSVVLSATAQTVTQQFNLRAGWNSIWLEVEPTNAAINVVFAGKPVSSIWTYVDRSSRIEFVQQQTEELFNQPGWLPFFPANRPESFLTKLREVHALKAYLVNVTETTTVTVVGTPAVTAAGWVSDSFNLRGFPVNPKKQPTFSAFFSASKAHAGQAFYELGADGEWKPVNTANAVIRHGEAYWAFCKGASTYEGPTGIRLEFGTGLHYGALLNELQPAVVNETATTRRVCWTDFQPGGVNPLSHQVFTNNRLGWENLPSPWCFDLAAGDEIGARIGIRRKDMPLPKYSGVLEVTDDIGTRYLVPVSAEKLLPARSGLAAPPGLGHPAAGLWVGTASVTNVNEVNSLQPERLTPTRSAFDLRLIVHVNEQGQTRLLKEVIQMWQDGTADRPGRFVLLTTDRLVPQFRGASLRDGVPVGRRISTVDFDFEGQDNTLNMEGRFEIGSTNACTIVLEPQFPTNPFRHAYHPDHDNLDATFQNFKPEAYRITRQIELRYSAVDPGGRAASSTLEYGHSVLGGTYHETVTGLNRAPIRAQGSFRLSRVSNSPVLNQ